MTRQTNLGKALPIKYGKARTDAAGYVAENIPVYGSSGVIGTYGRALTTGPSLIVGRKGSAGSVRFAPEPCWPIDTVYYAEPTPDTHLPYFAYLLEHLQLGQHDKSTAIPSLGRDDYNAIEVSVPNVDRQREVVAYLDEQLSRLDASVAALRRAQANLKRYRASVLKAACEGRLVPTEAELARAERRTFETGAQLLQRILAERRAASGMRKEPTGPEAVDLPMLPDGWEWATVQQLGLVSGGLTKNPKREVLPTKLPYLRVANVYANELRLDQIEYIGVAPTELDKLLLSMNDLLVVEGNGSPDQIGRVALWNGSITPCVHQNHLIKVRLCGADPRWVLNWLLSPQGRNQIERVTSSTSGLHTLSTGKVAALRVPLPPLPEQHRIVAEADRRLSLIRGAEAQVSANLARAKRLRQSILQAAFANPGSAGQ